MNSQYKLIYYDCRIRGELSRLIFAAAKQPYEDMRVEHSAWNDLKTKIKAPFGELPLLEVHDNDSSQFVLAQSHIIERFLANRFELTGKNDIEKAQLEMIVDLLSDIYEPLFYANFLEKNEERRASICEEICTRRAPMLLDYLEDLLKNSTNAAGGFLIGDSLTYADLALFNACDNCFGDKKRLILANYPLVRAHEAKIRSLAQIADYLAKRPKTRF